MVGGGKSWQINKMGNILREMIKMGNILREMIKMGNK